MGIQGLPTGIRRVAAPLVGLGLLGVILAVLASPAPASESATRPPIRHVFVIVLENESVSTTCGPHSPAPYLAKTLTSEGAYLPKYSGNLDIETSAAVRVAQEFAKNIQSKREQAAASR